jgi:molecular chaperone IbpA
MRSFDLSPFHRTTIGFDRLFSLLDQVSGEGQAGSTYPPYNIERTDENAYRITVAVAGFSEADLTIETVENSLLVKGEKEAKENGEAEFLFRGIATRAFERRFQLADYVSVQSARLENGLLHIELVREVPEAKKPRQIAIAAATAPRTKPKAITAAQAA